MPWGIAAAAVIGGVATVTAASDSESAITSASNAAIGEENTALSQEEAETAPYTGLGQSAIPQLESLLGLSGSTGSNGAVAGVNSTGQTVNASGQPTTSSTLAALEAIPGYQFTLSQGLQSTTNQATASGILDSGNTLEALDNYSSGLADNTYEQAVTNAQNAVNTGANAATNTASNIGTTASNVASTETNTGNTLAGIDANEAAGITSALGDALNNYTLNNTLQGLLSPAAGNLGADAGLSNPELAYI